MMSKLLKSLLLVCVICVMVPQANAAVQLNNGSFEGYIGGSMPIAPFVDLASHWDVEETTVLGGLQNCSIVEGYIGELGPTPAPIDGVRYMRLAHDHDGTTSTPGGISQNIGSMVAGESYTVEAGVVAWSAIEYCQDYELVLELYAMSIAPGNLLASDFVSLLGGANNLDPNGSGLPLPYADGVLLTDTLSATTAAIDGIDLIVRIAVADGSFGAAPTRGGIDVVTATPEPATIMLLGLGSVALIRKRK